MYAAPSVSAVRLAVTPAAASLAYARMTSRHGSASSAIATCVLGKWDPSIGKTCHTDAFEYAAPAVRIGVSSAEGPARTYPQPTTVSAATPTRRAGRRPRTTYTDAITAT